MKYLKDWNPILLFILLIPLLASQCAKDDMEPQLPPITMEGKNTFGCRVNGEIWIPEAPFSLYDSKLDSYYNSDIGGLNIAATREVPESNVFQSVTISGEDIFEAGDFEYNNTQYKDFDATFCINFRFLLDTTLGDKLKILYLNTENRIISGTFEFTAVNDECDPVVITDGRFDVQY